MTSMYNHSCCIDYLIGSRLHNLVPFAWCHSIRLSSLRALVRFSSWSWRWMFSSIRAWMVSWSSKFNVGRTSRARGAKNSSGFGPLMAALVPGDKNHIFGRWCLSSGKVNPVQREKFVQCRTARCSALCPQRGGDNGLFPRPRVESRRRAALKSIHRFHTSDHNRQSSRTLLYDPLEIFQMLIRHSNFKLNFNNNYSK